jgi:hypothetical protein
MASTTQLTHIFGVGISMTLGWDIDNRFLRTRNPLFVSVLKVERALGEVRAHQTPSVKEYQSYSEQAVPKSEKDSIVSTSTAGLHASPLIKEPFKS